MENSKKEPLPGLSILKGGERVEAARVGRIAWCKCARARTRRDETGKGIKDVGEGSLELDALEKKRIAFDLLHDDGNDDAEKRVVCSASELVKELWARGDLARSGREAGEGTTLVRRIAEQGPDGRQALWRREQRQ